MGIAASGIGIGLPNPYLGSTTIGVFLPATAGVIVPLQYAPQWLRHIAGFIPGGRAVQTIYDGSLLFHAVVVDVLVSLAWAAVGIVFVRVAISRIRNGSKVSVL